MVGSLTVELHVTGQIEKRLFHEPRHHAGIGPAAGNGRRANTQLAPHLKQVFAHLVVRAVGVVELGVVVKSGPRFIHRIDTQGIGLARQLDDVDGTHVNGKVHDQGLPGAGGEQRR